MRNKPQAALWIASRPTLAAVPEDPIEYRIKIDDPWKRQLFIALCRCNEIYPSKPPAPALLLHHAKYHPSMLDQVLCRSFWSSPISSTATSTRPPGDIITRFRSRERQLGPDLREWHRLPDLVQ
ncbi:MAG: hypothetical protein R3F31_00895 [Verrucomicrobiales bacterium]